MSEGAVADKRSRRLYVYWGVALTLLAALGFACRFVVVPVMETRAVVRITYGCYSSSEMSKDEILPDEAVKRLGGKAAAESKLRMYLRLPDWIAPDKHRANRLLYLMKDAPR